MNPIDQLTAKTIDAILVHVSGGNKNKCSWGCTVLSTLMNSYFSERQQLEMDADRVLAAQSKPCSREHKCACEDPCNGFPRPEGF
jgi:hypothetical protein